MAAPKLSTTMEAIHISAFVQSLSDIRVSRIPIPALTPSTLLIRITHASPTHVDLLYSRGRHQNNRRHARPPFVLGTDFAGVVVRTPARSAFAAGDRVYGACFDGAFAEYVAVEEGALGGVRKVPRGWALRDACALGASGAIGLGAWYRAGLTAEEVRRRKKCGEETWVLVTGATGGLGVVAVQLAKALGAKVVALVGAAPRKREVLERLGVDAVVRYDGPKWEEEVRRIADGDGVHVVYDAVGMVESGLRCCRYGGTLVIVGFAGRDNETIERVPMNRILLKSASVVGYRFGEHGRRNPDAVADIWSDYERMASAGMIKAVIHDHDYRGVRDIPTAMMDLAARRVHGRAVVEIASEDDVLSRIASQTKL